MKILLIIPVLTILVLSSCKETVEVEKLVHDTVTVTKTIEKIKPIDPKIKLLNNQLAGIWNVTQVIVQPWNSNKNTNYGVSAVMGDSYVCGSLDTLLWSKNAPKKYSMRYENDTLKLTKTFFCSTRVDNSFLTIAVDDKTNNSFTNWITNEPLVITEQRIDTRKVTSFYEVGFLNTTFAPPPGSSPVMNSATLYVKLSSDENGAQPKQYILSLAKQ